MHAGRLRGVHDVAQHVHACRAQQELLHNHFHHSLGMHNAEHNVSVAHCTPWLLGLPISSDEQLPAP